MVIVYRCNICNAEFIMQTDYIKAKEIQGKYISCNFGHRSIKRVGQFKDLATYQEYQDKAIKKLMEERKAVEL
ncbi:MAG TPA: hypothetical protein VFC79_02070 [Tissierellaceae bacterium]|nr:hypothetical protein [Tissierellaceae bacterium]